MCAKKRVKRKENFVAEDFSCLLGRNRKNRCSSGRSSGVFLGGVNPKSESEKRVILIGGADFAREESKVCCEFLCWSAFRGEVRKKGVKI